MSNPLSPVNQPGAWDTVAPNYANFIADHLGHYALEALQWAEVQADERLLDVATGPGTLALPASRITQVDALDFSAGMLEQIRQRADEAQLANLTLHEGDGLALPFDDDLFDAAFSMFGLFLFPDRAKGFAELARVVRPGGRAAVASWQPQEAIPVFHIISTEVLAIIGAPPREEGQPLADPDVFRQEMEAAGFDVEIRAFTHTLEAPSLDDLWSGMRKSHVALSIAKSKLSPLRYELLLQHIKLRLVEKLGTGPQSIVMPAWIGLGRL